MPRIDTDWRDDLPMRDEIEDCAGKIRTFMISCHEGRFGYTVRAVEENSDGMGYEFAAYSETTPYSALGRLRHKMHRALAMRHVTRKSGDYVMLHDVLRGRITWSEPDGIQLIVDGTPLGVDQLAAILAGHEGWEFELRIRDALE